MPLCQKGWECDDVGECHPTRLGQSNANTGEVTSLKNTDGNINNGQENIKQLRYLSIQKLNQYRKSDRHNIVKEDYLIDRGNETKQFLKTSGATGIN